MTSMRDRLLSPRTMVGVAALLLLLVYHWPLWTIQLVAPQYPEGLGMYIGISEVRGHDTHDLQNINILNHYIGMQAIEPEAIPELDWMPLILGGLIVTGLLAAAIGNRWVMGAWLLVFLGLGAVGMADFYMWKQDYGHNLSPDAPIKVPGMTYQPPLIGTKQLLNIRASSYPYWGTAILTLSALLGAFGVWRAFRRRRAPRSPEVHAPARSGAARLVAPGAALLIFGAAACGGSEGTERTSAARGGGDGPVAAMVYGQDMDPFCGGEVDRVRWGGELRTSSGDRIRFRSVECLAGYVLAGRVDPDEVDEVLVVDFPDGRRLVEVSRAVFLHTPNLASPDRLNLMAVRSEDEKMIQNLQDAYTGTLLGWDEVLELVSRRWEPAVGAGGCLAASQAGQPVCG